MNKPPNFNRLARLYLWMELLSFGLWLSLTRQTFLPRLGQARRALVLGDGDGRFSAKLLCANSQVRITAVDASSAMLAALTRRAGRHHSRVETQKADIRTWFPPAALEPYDLIATHFFLDCLTTPEVQSLASRLRSASTPNALWVVSDFAVPDSAFGRFLAFPIVTSLYLSFAVLTGLAVRRLPDHATALTGAGFTLLKRRSRLAGLLIAELWSASVPGSDPSPASSAL
jgi:SAM-dependent methyltransferase